MTTTVDRVAQRRQRNREHCLAYQARFRDKLASDPEFAKEYRAKRAEQSRLRRVQDREHRLAYERQWYAENRHKRNAECAEYRQRDREAYNDKQRKSYIKYRKERIARNKTWKSLNADYERERKLQSQYGITLADRDAMIAEQGGLCLVCEKPLDLTSSCKSRFAPVVDHCHTTKRNRAILHRGCNVGMGHFNDDPRLLRKAAEYLERVLGEAKSG